MGKFNGKTFKSIASAVDASNTVNLFNNKAIDKAESILFPDEEIVRALSGVLKSGTGILVLTTKRLFSYMSMLGDTQQEEIPIEEIKQVNIEKPLLQQATISVMGKHNDIEIKFSRKAADDFYNAIGEVRRFVSQNKNENSAQTSNEKDSIQLLKELNELYKSGILTEEEFTLKKKQILGI
ncbi:PH domain-containing protein [Ruminococcus bromii]|jgi:hypothetical protein|uniref:PH domain-containing protein n=1 Tax=Ruminococcus bromii TaxID=40518 RepID=UPI00205CB4AD|nr:MAG TPA: Short C-terminal domain [Caudoviricetes sp.]